MRGGRAATWRERGSSFYVSLTRQTCVFSPRFSLCPARPERPLGSGDMLGASDTVLDCVGQKEALRHVARNEILFHALQIFLEATLGDAAGDSLITLGVDAAVRTCCLVSGHGHGPGPSILFHRGTLTGLTYVRTPLARTGTSYI
jgi:hypothetical protein